MFYLSFYGHFVIVADFGFEACLQVEEVEYSGIQLSNTTLMYSKYKQIPYF